MSEAGRAERLAFIERWLGTFRAMTELRGDEAIDRDLLIGELEAAEFSETELREETWNPLEWIYLLGGGLFSLLAREFAPLDVRLDVDRGTARATPRGGRRRPASDRRRCRPAGGPVPDRDRAQAAARDRGAHRGCAPHGRGRDRRPGGSGADPAAPRGGRDCARGHGGVRDPPARGGPSGQRWRGPSWPRAVRAERCVTRCARPSSIADRILATAERDYEAVRAELVRLARDAWPAWRPGEALPDDDGAVVRNVLDAIAAEHPRADELLEFCREENARIEAFCAEQGPDRPGGRAARDPLDAGVHARLRRRDAELAGTAGQGPEGVLLDHADARRLD